MSPMLQRCDPITRLVLLPYWQDSLATWILRLHVAYVMWHSGFTEATATRLVICARAAYSFALDILDYREE